jgi:hypothetical protein
MNRGPTWFEYRGQRIESVVCITGTLGQRQRRWRLQAVSSLATRSPVSLTLWWAEFQMDVGAPAQRRRSRVHFADRPSATRPAWTFDKRQISEKEITSNFQSDPILGEVQYGLETSDGPPSLYLRTPQRGAVKRRAREMKYFSCIPAGACHGRDFLTSRVCLVPLFQ